MFSVTSHETPCNATTAPLLRPNRSPKAKTYSAVSKSFNVGASVGSAASPGSVGFFVVKVEGVHVVLAHKVEHGLDPVLDNLVLTALGDPGLVTNGENTRDVLGSVSASDGDADLLAVLLEDGDAELAVLLRVERVAVIAPLWPVHVVDVVSSNLTEAEVDEGERRGGNLFPGRVGTKVVEDDFGLGRALVADNVAKLGDGDERRTLHTNVDLLEERRALRVEENGEQRHHKDENVAEHAHTTTGALDRRSSSLLGLAGLGSNVLCRFTVHRGEMRAMELVRERCLCDEIRGTNTAAGLK